MNPFPYRWCISPLILAVLGLLSGRTDTSSPAVMFERALERIANATGVEPGPPPARLPLPPYPRPRDLRLEPLDLRVGFAGLIRLGECRLLGEVTARNSSLGKFQADSSRLLYELRFYRELTLCQREQASKSAPDSEFLSQLHRTARPIMDSLDQLVRVQNVEPPPAFRDFQAATLAPDAPGALWPAFQAGIARHTRAWQTVPRQCQLMPGISADNAGPPPAIP